MKKEKEMQVAEINVSYNRPEKIWDKKIDCSAIIVEALRSFWNNDHIEFIEEFNIILLDTSNNVIGFRNISRGGMTQTIVDAKIIFGIALKCAASQIILSHNHPSGSLKPSQSDLDLTRKLIKGGEILEIRVLDHIILSKENYFSFADEFLI